MPIFSYEQLHSSLNHRLTKALFVETCSPEHQPLMTLGRREKKGLFCLRDIFIPMVAEDPSEYKFAEYVFGDYAFWDNLTKSTWMKPYLEEWRMVAATKRKSMAFEALAEEVKGGKNSYGAARFLIEEPWKDKRTKKEQEASRKSTEEAHKTVFREDAERLKEFKKVP